jgi:hypothetical protein
MDCERRKRVISFFHGLIGKTVGITDKFEMMD